MKKGYESLESRFYRRGDTMDMDYYPVPEKLFYDMKYSNLSIGAKSLYSIMLDRLYQGKSINQRDDQGHCYFNFPITPAKGDLRSIEEKAEYEWSMTELMKCCEKTVRKYKKELKEADLLKEINQGQGKLSRLYLAKP